VERKGNLIENYTSFPIVSEIPKETSSENSQDYAQKPD
jgi:uncharacterized protein Veg